MWVVVVTGEDGAVGVYGSWRARGRAREFAQRLIDNGMAATLSPIERATLMNVREQWGESMAAARPIPKGGKS